MCGKAANIRGHGAAGPFCEQIVRSTTAPQRLVQRARLILLAFGGLFNGAIGEAIGLERKQVGLWRRRWQQSFNALGCRIRESQAALRRSLRIVLGDAPRGRSSGKFQRRQVTQVWRGREPRKPFGRPTTSGPDANSADELVKRGVVEAISVSQVNRYLAESELQPHRSKYWAQHHREKPRAVREAGSVGFARPTWMPPPAPCIFQHHTHTVSVDEMTSVQAWSGTRRRSP